MMRKSLRRCVVHRGLGWVRTTAGLTGPSLQETDYIMSYFDNGEEFGGDSDDNMDEAIY